MLHNLDHIFVSGKKSKQYLEAIYTIVDTNGCCDLQGKAKWK